MQSALLEELQQKLQQPYLSDLHMLSPVQFESIFDYVDINSYTVEEWNYALSYILGRKVECKNKKQIEQLKDKLLEFKE